MTSIAELRGWHRRPGLESSETNGGFEGFSPLLKVDAYFDWIRSGDHEVYLASLDAWQDFMSRQKDQYLLLSERSMIDYCEEFQIQIGGSPAEYARYVWGHEKAHQGVARRWGVASAIRLTWVPKGGGRYLVQPWLHKKISDLENMARGGALFSAIGEILLAPSKIGLGYASEEELALSLLQVAREREGYLG